MPIFNVYLKKPLDFSVRYEYLKAVGILLIHAIYKMTNSYACYSFYFFKERKSWKNDTFRFDVFFVLMFPDFSKSGRE